MDFGEYQSRMEDCRDLLEAERFEEAYGVALELLFEYDSDAAVVAMFCDACIASDRAAEAVRTAQRYLKRFEPEIEVLEYLAQAQWSLDLYEPCRRTCRKLLNRMPDNYTALDYGLATTLELGDYEDARDIIELAVDNHRGDDHLRYQTAVARMMRRSKDEGDDAWAREVFDDFLAREPGEPGTYINLMRIHHLHERFARVEDLYRAATSQGLAHEDLDFNMGLALKAQDRDRESARYFISAIRRNPGIPDAHFHLGQILRTEGHQRMALWILDRELSVDDTHPAVHAEMAWCSEDLGEYAAAVRMIRAAVERAPDWAIYQHSCAELLLKENPESTEAGEVAARAVALDDSFAAGWQILGRLAAERQDFEEAGRCLEMAVIAPDATAEDRGWYGLVLAELGRADEAFPMLEAAARVHQSWPAVAVVLGELRGRPLPKRYEVRFSGRDDDGQALYRVLHIVAKSQAAARIALKATEHGDRSSEAEITRLGYDVDHEPGIVWDSGLTDQRYPPPPPPPMPAD
ncbi:MAG: hypothetical protein ABFS86_09360 [Planctomycetota bacterium]